MAELEVKGLKFRSGAKTIVDDVSFSVKDREMFVLCGPSGAGKTSILRLITGEWDPDSGEVLLSGENITKLPMQKRDTVLVSQSNNLFPHFTVRENAAFGLKARKIGGNEARERIGYYAEKCGITELLDRYPSELSGGQQKLAAILRAIVVKPKVLLLDEPFTGLDNNLVCRMREFCLRLQRENGITAVMITHSKEDAFFMGQRIGFLFDGRLELTAPVTELYEKTGNEKVDRFLGEIVKTADGGFVFADKVLRSFDPEDRNEDSK